MKYFAKVLNGVVVDIRRVSADYMVANPEFYPGDWVEFADKLTGPSLGYTYDAEHAFRPPCPEIGSYSWDDVTRTWVANSEGTL